jgi:hypothetical protein
VLPIHAQSVMSNKLTNTEIKKIPEFNGRSDEVPRETRYYMLLSLLFLKYSLYVGKIVLLECMSAYKQF